ncbi:tetratricopeptide repeat protein [Acidithiobacillus sp. M4-SHS-6]|uniref:tetratricopeptide repeat protein n=1 Tax=Acidithiobacillus sp. M4-SHS-6 TaxID=3383024 RepID=UPI0039BE0D4F
MQGLMIFLEVVVVLLLLLEVFVRLRARRRRLQQRDAQLSPEARKKVPLSSVQESPVSLPEVLPVHPHSEQGGALQEALSIDDLLNEANIYLEYGHYAQAATVLRWYVDLNPHETRVINQLLDTYLALADMDSYAGLLESLGEKSGRVPMDESWWRERVEHGLQQDPGNLELLVLAEKVGMAVPLPQEQGAEPPMTAEMALALVARNRDPHYGMAILWRAIAHEPLRLPLYAELLRITHQQHLLEDYINALILLYLTVGYKAKTLRERMLRAGEDLGNHPLWTVLADWDGNPETLRQLACSRQLEIPGSLPLT